MSSLTSLNAQLFVVRQVEAYLVSSSSKAVFDFPVSSAFPQTASQKHRSDMVWRMGPIIISNNRDYSMIGKLEHDNA